MSDLRSDLTALADEWEESYERWRYVHDGPRVAIFHAHATRLRQVLAAHPAPEAPEATVVEEWGWRYETGFVTVLSSRAIHGPDPIKPNVRRTRTTYADHVSPWVEVETTTATTTEGEPS